MNRLALKTLAVATITIGLLVPLTMIRGLISERTRYRDSARADIARSWTSDQAVFGPVLVIPTRRVATSGSWSDRTHDWRGVFSSPTAPALMVTARKRS